METYYMVLGIAGLIFAIIDARTVDQFKRGLNGVADSTSLILLSVIRLRVSLSRLVVHLFRWLWKCASEKSMGGQREWKSDVKSEGASGVNTSGIMQFVGQIIETVNELGDGVCRLLRGVLSLCGAAIHLFQGAFYLVTAAIQLEITVLVYTLSATSFKQGSLKKCCSGC